MVYSIAKSIEDYISQKYDAKVSFIFDKDDSSIFYIPLHKLKVSLKRECEDIGKEIIEDLGIDAEVDGCFLKLNVSHLHSWNVEIPQVNKGKVFLVEFSSPNIAKPFNVGHLRSTVLGDSIARMIVKSGGKVVRVNYLGDWGVQFGKLIVSWKKYGDESELKRRGIRYLFDLYVKIHQEEENDESIKVEGEKEFIKLEQGDPENTRLWEMFRDISIQEFMRIYNLLGIKFDVIEGESTYVSLCESVIDDLLKRGIAFVDKDKSVVVPTPKGNLVIYKKGERTLYSTRDISALRERCSRYYPYEMIYVVGSEQKQYFEQIFYVGKESGYCRCKLVHADFGLMYLPEGKFSTRKGNVVFVEDFVSFLKERISNAMRERGKEYSEEEIETFALNTVKFALLSQSRRKNFMFNTEKFTSYNNENAIYLLYTYARARSVVHAYGGFNVKDERVKKEIVSNEHAIRTMNYLLKFPFYFMKSLQNYDPHYLIMFGLEASKRYNTLYQNVRFIGNSEFEHAGYRISSMLIDALRQVFNIAGIKEMENI